MSSIYGVVTISERGFELVYAKYLGSDAEGLLVLRVQESLSDFVKEKHRWRPFSQVDLAEKRWLESYPGASPVRSVKFLSKDELASYKIRC